MMASGRLFLLGGAAARQAAADAFIPEAGGASGVIALLLSGEPGWEAYVPGYVEAWERRGVAHVHVVAPGGDGALDLEEAAETLRRATGIYVGGGDTAVYHRAYATEPVRSLIRERVAAGTPYAGVSAGALIAPRFCGIQAEGVPLEVVEGLGLVADLVVGVHFTERHALPGVLDVMTRTRTAVGLGIDDGACAVFEGGRLVRALGESVHRIEMTDFECASFEPLRLCGEFLGRTVAVTIDRPLGSRHPEHGFVYPVNYGYVPGTLSGDGEEIDAYVLGVFEPVDAFEGRCTAVIHRSDDDDDKLVVVPGGVAYSIEQIRALVAFQERFFTSTTIEVS